MSKYKKTFYASLITLGCVLFILILLIILRTSPDISEWWSRNISRIEQIVASKVFGWLPISGFELFVIALIIFIIIWLILVIRHLHRFKFRGSSHYWLNMGIVLSIIFTVYMGTAGMEYNRYMVPIPQYTQLIENPKDYYEIASFFQDDFNEISTMLKYDENGMLIMPYTYDQMNKIMTEEFKKLNTDYYTTDTAKTKNMYLLGWFYRELHITGVAFGPTGEPNVNPLTTPSEYAFTMAHEIAHTKGIIREEDANLVAAYICLTSDNVYLRYSGYIYTIYTLNYLVACTNDKDLYKAYTSNFSEQIQKDSKAISEYWNSHSFLKKIGEFFNDLYLKLQGESGTASYDDDIHIIDDGGKYVVTSYSRYQALYLWIYFNFFNNQK